jgi:hypothetical protein
MVAGAPHSLALLLTHGSLSVQISLSGSQQMLLVTHPLSGR